MEDQESAPGVTDGNPWLSSPDMQDQRNDEGPYIPLDMPTHVVSESVAPGGYAALGPDPSLLPSPNPPAPQWDAQAPLYNPSWVQPTEPPVYGPPAPEPQYEPLIHHYDDSQPYYAYPAMPNYVPPRTWYTQPQPSGIY